MHAGQHQQEATCFHEDHQSMRAGICILCSSLNRASCLPCKAQNGNGLRTYGPPAIKCIYAQGCISLRHLIDQHPAATSLERTHRVPPHCRMHQPPAIARVCLQCYVCGRDFSNIRGVQARLLRRATSQESSSNITKHVCSMGCVLLTVALLSSFGSASLPDSSCDSLSSNSHSQQQFSVWAITTSAACMGFMLLSEATSPHPSLHLGAAWGHPPALP